jgi:hypothetical protein
MNAMSLYDVSDQLESELYNFVKNIQNIDNIKVGNELTSISDKQVQQLFSLGFKLYIKRLQENPEMQPFPNVNSVTPTEAVVTVTRILKQINIEVFELAMWQTLGSIK